MDHGGYRQSRWRLKCVRLSLSRCRVDVENTYGHSPIDAKRVHNAPILELLEAVVLSAASAIRSVV